MRNPEKSAQCVRASVQERARANFSLPPCFNIILLLFSYCDYGFFSWLLLIKRLFSCTARQTCAVRGRKKIVSRVYLALFISFAKQKPVYVRVSVKPLRSQTPPPPSGLPFIHKFLTPPLLFLNPRLHPSSSTSPISARFIMLPPLLTPHYLFLTPPTHTYTSLPRLAFHHVQLPHTTSISFFTPSSSSIIFLSLSNPFTPSSSPMNVLLMGYNLVVFGFLHRISLTTHAHIYIPSLSF